MSEATLGLLFYAALAVGTAAAILTIAGLFAPRLSRREKAAPYECGVPQSGPTRLPIDVRFYLVAILFVVFDVEVVFLIPWAVLHRELGWAGLVEAGVFVAVLAAGLLYAWGKGVLDWGAEQ